MEQLIVNRMVPGMVIKILRSNGLVHTASVTSVNPDRASVHVEWKESDISKGKEILFADVVSVNPELLEAAYDPPSKENMPPQRNMAAQQNQRRKTSSRIPGLTKEVTATTGVGVESAAQTALRGRSIKMSAIPETRAIDLDMEVEPVPQPTVQQSINNSMRTRSTKYNSIGESRLLPRVNELVEESAASTAKSNAARRKSNIVNEMEKMKNKRQEQRAQNSEMRTKRAQDCDTTVPNWEFGKMIKDFRSTLECHRISMTDSADEHRICVCVRKRPLNKQELAKREFDIVSVPSKSLVLVHEPKFKVDLTKYLENQAFRFDYTFDETSANDIVYRFTARPLVQAIFEGGKATCFAYGQTGSGKTHTMGGDFLGKSQNVTKGIYAFASRDVFLLLSQPRYQDMDLEVFVTFFEIYNGKVFDLLNKKAKLRVLEDAKQEVQVVGLLEREVACAEDVFKMIEVGSACRTSGQTFANSSSSRSHACLQIILRRRGKLHGKFSLVDLAGNERGADTASADRITRMEGAEINRSLLALKECIRALGQNKAHTPFRESKLTQILRDSFIGENSRTCMIAMLSPGLSSCEYTLNTLRYADRVKELNPHNAEPADNQQMETEFSDGSRSSSIGGSDFQDDLSLKDEEELSTMNSFQDAMSRMGELEEKAVEELRELVQKTPEWSNLLEVTEQPDYDLENFVTQAEYLINESSKALISLGECVTSLRAAMQMEEQASQQITKSRRPVK
ncbi:kinesin-like protein KIF2C isoform X2 [Rana temporaria]|uniref:kinesin-like protein KIF2C isoform X2 n=1 Tax=Rana temporaria TaxID=8407 RepID=UPI001AAD37F5|nr:kinesin-like protein KIF2C isoform X2 [Rana temporaria]